MQLLQKVDIFCVTQTPTWISEQGRCLCLLCCRPVWEQVVLTLFALFSVYERIKDTLCRAASSQSSCIIKLETMLGLNLIWGSHPWYLPKLCCSRDHDWPWALSPATQRLNHSVTTTSPGHYPPMPLPGPVLTLTLFGSLGHRGTAPL